MHSLRSHRNARVTRAAPAKVRCERAVGVAPRLATRLATRRPSAREPPRAALHPPLPAVNGCLSAAEGCHSARFWQGTAIGELESARSHAVLRARKLTSENRPMGPTWERYGGGGEWVVVVIVG